MDLDDPFQLFNHFMQAMQTGSETRSSDRINIEVLPLPGAGQPANFSGLVGDFDISAGVDKYTVKMGEPINLKVKIEGTGHAGVLEHLNVAWPQDFELYEDKSNTQFMKTGRTERMFEYMVIPKAKGKFEIPGIEISMFNPVTKAYQTRKTQSIQIEVLEGSLGNVYVAKGKSGQPQQTTEDIRYWMASDPGPRSGVVSSVGRVFTFGALAFALIGLLSLKNASATELLRQKRLRQSAGLKENARMLAQSSEAPPVVLGKVENLLGQAIELRYGILIGSLTRSEVRQSLLEKAKTDENVAKRVEALLELCENQRYAPGGGDSTSARSAAEELARLVDRLQSS
jgi:hypothetical protein